MHFPPIDTDLRCTVIGEEMVRCTNLTIELVPAEKPLTPNEKLFWAYLVAYLVMVLIAGKWGWGMFRKEVVCVGTLGPWGLRLSPIRCTCYVMSRNPGFYGSYA